MSQKNKRAQYLAGARAGVPVLFGFIPVGIAYAIMARQAGFSGMETVLMSAAVFAGASQMMAVGMYAQGAGTIAMILATFILNLRHLIMSTCVINLIKNEPVRRKLLAAFGVTDESFALFTTTGEGHCNGYYFLGMITVTYSAWVGGSAIGALASEFLPEIISASFGIALYAMFLGILVPNLRKESSLAYLVILAALCNTLVSQFIAPSWALIFTTIFCAAAGTFFVRLDEGGAQDAK